MLTHTVRFATLEDSDFIDSVIARPDVLPMIAAVERLNSVKPLIGDHIFMVCEGGFVYAEPLGSGDFGCIGAFLPEYRGLYAVMAMREAIRKTFVETECSRLIGTAFIGDIDISRMWKSIGFQKIGQCSGRIIGSLDYLLWSITDREIGAIGSMFAAIHKIKDDGPMWCRAFGALILSVAHGNIVKGIHQHNLYCVGTGHSPITVGLGAELQFVYGGVEFSEQDIIDFIMGNTEAREV